MNDTKTIKEHLRNILKNKFDVLFEHSFKFDNTSYRPDVVLKDKKYKKIKAIIEIEQCARKHVVGGVITAGYCMKKIRPKPIMFVLSLKAKNTKDYKKRIPMLKHYIKSFKDIIIDNKMEIITALMKLKS